MIWDDDIQYSTKGMRSFCGIDGGEQIGLMKQRHIPMWGDWLFERYAEGRDVRDVKKAIVREVLVPLGETYRKMGDGYRELRLLSGLLKEEEDIIEKAARAEASLDVLKYRLQRVGGLVGLVENLKSKSRELSKVHVLDRQYYRDQMKALVKKYNVVVCGEVKGERGNEHRVHPDVELMVEIGHVWMGLLAEGGEIVGCRKYIGRWVIRLFFRGKKAEWEVERVGYPQYTYGAHPHVSISDKRGNVCTGTAQCALGAAMKEGRIFDGVELLVAILKWCNDKGAYTEAHWDDFDVNGWNKRYVEKHRRQARRRERRRRIDAGEEIGVDWQTTEDGRRWAECMYNSGRFRCELGGAVFEEGEYVECCSCGVEVGHRGCLSYNMRRLGGQLENMKCGRCSRSVCPDCYEEGRGIWECERCGKRRCPSCREEEDVDPWVSCGGCGVHFCPDCVCNMYRAGDDTDRCYDCHTEVMLDCGYNECDA
jgi:hypothetical protein